MQPLKVKQFANLKWSVAVLIAIASVMILAGTASQAQHENGSGKLVATAAGTDATSQVMIDNFVYNPVPLTIKVGTTVTWINHDDIPHTVDSTEGKFKSGALDTDDKFEYRFTAAGEYPFYCRIHPKMTGKIIVQP
ncbi:MAG TPA: cupredoxin family copper-binding protein [Blastocatellia bacterium]|jgi:plastocyanin|nr:cupredoxin family copper-binding protein [Blastocatellia bacterium]